MDYDVVWDEFYRRWEVHHRNLRPAAQRGFVKRQDKEPIIASGIGYSEGAKLADDANRRIGSK